MEIDPNLVALALITAFAAVTQAATGFGFAIIALPPFLLLMGSLDAVVLTIVLNLLISVVLAPRLWGRVPRDLLLRLAAGSLAGFPLGLWIFQHASLAAVKLAAGVVILFFTALVARPPRAPSSAGGTAAPFGIGLVSGTMATSLAMPGPAAMLYLLRSPIDDEERRSCLLVLFLLSYGCALGLQVAVTPFDAALWRLCGLLGVVAVAGAFVGDRLAGRLDRTLARRIVLAILFATGGMAAVTGVADLLAA